MEALILDDLKDLGKTISAKEFKKIINGGIISIKYTQLVEWITKEIHILSGLEEYVNAISSEADSNSFLLEVSSFLKESGCSYNTLTTGNFEDRLKSNENRLLLLDYLIGELRAARIINVNDNKKSNMKVLLIESNTSKCLKNIINILKFPESLQNITISYLFNKVNNKLQELLKNVSPTLIGKSLVCNSYSDEQWNYINNTTELLNEEFNMRRSMLLTRLDVTVQSFKWPDRLKNKKHELEEIYQTKLNIINHLPSFSIADFLSAREDLTIIEKTSSTLAVQNTNSLINKVMIGRVPDRGGRPDEQQAPPPEMPSWQQRTQSQGGRGGQSNRGQFNSKNGRGEGQKNRGSQFYKNTVDNQGGANVYQNMTDGFQSIYVGSGNRNYNHSSRGSRVQGGWSDNQSRNIQDGNFRGQSNSDNFNQGYNRNVEYNNIRFNNTPSEREWNQESQNAYGNNQGQYYSRNESADTNRRGYSKRGRGHNGQTYYNQQRNNQHY